MKGQNKLNKRELRHLKEMRIATVGDLQACLAAQKGSLPCKDCTAIAKKAGGL